MFDWRSTRVRLCAAGVQGAERDGAGEPGQADRRVRGAAGEHGGGGRPPVPQRRHPPHAEAPLHRPLPRPHRQRGQAPRALRGERSHAVQLAGTMLTWTICSPATNAFFSAGGIERLHREFSMGSERYLVKFCPSIQKGLHRSHSGSATQPPRRLLTQTCCAAIVLVVHGLRLCYVGAL